MFFKIVNCGMTWCTFLFSSPSTSQAPRQSPGDHRGLASCRNQSMGAHRGQTRDGCQRQPVLWTLPQNNEHPGAPAAALWQRVCWAASHIGKEVRAHLLPVWAVVIDGPNRASVTLSSEKNRLVFKFTIKPDAKRANNKSTVHFVWLPSFSRDLPSCAASSFFAPLESKKTTSFSTGWLLTEPVCR